VLHVDVEEAEAARFAKHHQKNTGDRPMVVGWAPGELMVLDEGAIACPASASANAASSRPSSISSQE
jgi:hypothetical protein